MLFLFLVILKRLEKNVPVNQPSICISLIWEEDNTWKCFPNMAPGVMKSSETTFPASVMLARIHPAKCLRAKHWTDFSSASRAADLLTLPQLCAVGWLCLCRKCLRLFTARFTYSLCSVEVMVLSKPHDSFSNTPIFWEHAVFLYTHRLFFWGEIINVIVASLWIFFTTLRN